LEGTDTTDTSRVRLLKKLYARYSAQILTKLQGQLRFYGHQQTK